MPAKQTQDEVISDFIKIHNTTYDYSEVKYKTSQTPVIIICKIHGKFEQKPVKHKMGRCCNKCGIKKRNAGFLLTEEQILISFKEIHNKLYDYSLVKYVNNNTKVKIICKIHGIFEQEPRAHKMGQGCDKCARENNYKDIPTYLYYIRIQDQYKIGVTRKRNFKNGENAVRNRYAAEFAKGLDIEIISHELFNDGAEAYKLEQSIIENNSKYLILQENMILFTGYTETFIRNISVY